MKAITEQPFLTGTKYMARGKHPRECTVVDVHTTYNLAGDLVKRRYVSEHDFCGQTVTDSDVCHVTIQRGLVLGIQSRGAVK